VGWQIGGGSNTSNTISSVTDGAGNVYAEAGAARSIDASASTLIDIWYAKNSIAGATTLTVNPNISVPHAGVVIWEFSGASLTAPLDATAVLNSQAATTTPTGASVTATAANDVIVSIAEVANAVTGITSGNTFTNDSTIMSNGWAHLIASSSGAYAAKWNQNPSGTYTSSTAAFKAAVQGSFSACDLNQDTQVNGSDVTLAVNMALGTSSCTANIEGPLACTVVTVQRVINASLGQSCLLYNAPTSPAITSATSASGTVGSAFSYQITATNSPTSYGASGLPAGLSVNTVTGLISGAPTTAGTSSVTLSATNSGGIGNATLTLTVSPAASHSVTLSWVASTSQSVAGYNIYRGTASGGPYSTKVNSAVINATTFTDTAVLAGQTYYYVGTTMDVSGNESGYSNQATAVIPTP
jgi:hypothetical protein